MEELINDKAASETKNNARVMRRAAREDAFKLIFEGLINDTGDDSAVRIFSAQLDENGKLYMDRLLCGVREKKDFLVSVIGGFSSGFKTERLYKIDLSILLIAVYEILFIDEVPVKVSANEAVELAKAYSTDSSPAYINGILATVIKNKESILSERGDN